MKTIISLLTTMVFVFAFGTAFADEWQPDRSHLFLGSIPMDEVYPVQKTEVVQPGAAAGGMREEKLDRSAAIWESLFGNYESTDVLDTYRGFVKSETVRAVGAAPGGLRAEKADKGGEIFDSLLGERGSKADTHIAY